MKLPNLVKLQSEAKKVIKEKNIKDLCDDVVNRVGKKVDDFMDRPHKPPQQSTIDNARERIKKTNAQEELCPKCHGYKLLVYLDANGNAIPYLCRCCKGKGLVKK